jgi:PST family polysaccharide transporter
LLLGPKWLGVVPVVRILAIIGLVSAADGTRGVVLLSQGLSRRHFKWGLINAVALVCAFLAGLPFGIVGVAAAYTVASYVLLLPSLYYCFSGTPVSVGLFMRALAPSLLCAASAALGALMVMAQTGTRSLWAGIASSVVFVAVYIALAMTRHSVRDNVSRAVVALRSRVRAPKENA